MDNNPLRNILKGRHPELTEADVSALIDEGIMPSSLQKIELPKDLPPGAYGIPSLQLKGADQLRGTNIGAFVFDSGNDATRRALSDSVYINPHAPLPMPVMIAHEAEHLMARRQLGRTSNINKKFDELIGDTRSRAEFVKNAVAAEPYLKEQYGLNSGYFNPKMLERNGGRLLYEQLAELSALEQTKGVDLTKDPVLRKTLFKDKNVRETYSAITGLRQTRLDARDLPTYTRQPEPSPPGMLNKLRSIVGFSGGGDVSKAASTQGPRTMAQDDFQSFVERIKQAESAGQRFDKKGNLLTSSKGAQGEMQVMPATQRDPGFGVAPVKDKSPDEIARVGRDLLRAFDSKYGGNRMYAAAAYNWGPGNVDRWIAAGADFDKLPKETQNYLRKVAPEALAASGRKPAPAPATAAPQPAVMEPPLGISASAAPRAVAIGDSLAEGFAKANNLGGMYKSGAGPQAVMKMLQDYAANNSLQGTTVYLGTGLPNNPAQRDAVAQQVAFIKAQGGTPVVFGAGPGSQKNPTTGQNEFLQTVAQDSGAQFTGPLATLFPAISKQDPMGLHLTPAQYKELYKQTGGAPVTAAAPASRPVATAQAAPRAAAQASAVDLGSGYKAALALAFLGDEDKDREVSDEELRARMNRMEDEEFAQQLVDYKPVNTLQDLEITALNPVKALQPVRMAEGGVVGQSAADELRNLKLKMDLPSVADIRNNGGDFAAPAGPSSTINPATTIAVGQALQGYGNMFGGMLPGSSVANFAGNLAVNSGINSLSNMQNQEAMHTLAGRFGDEALAMHGMAEGRAASEAAANAAANEAGISAAFGNADSTYSGASDFNKGGEVDTKEDDAQKSGEAKNTPTIGEFSAPRMTARESARAALNTVFGIGMGPGMGANLGYSIYKHFSGETPLEDLLRRARQASQPIDPKREREPIEQSGEMRPIKRSNGSPETGEVALTPEEIAAASRPATFNPQIARQGAAARALAAQRDVNTLPDPRTYAAVSGFLGQAPDQLGFSAMHPDIAGITKAGEAGFAASLVPVVAPVVAPVAKAVGKGATALGMRTEKALEAPVTRTLERGGRSAEMLQALGAQPSFAIKPRGGHFELRPDASGPGMAVWDDVRQTVSDHLANTKDQQLNNWFNAKVTAYLRRDFGTESDQFVKAADAGKKLHLPNEPMDPLMRGSIQRAREIEGFPKSGFATTEYGKNIEDAIDASLNIRELGDLTIRYPLMSQRVPPSLMQFSTTNPEMRLYSLDEIVERGPRLGDLRDRMLELRGTNEVRFYGEPPVKIPDSYRITDQALQGLSPVQASEKVAQFDNWRTKVRQRAATSAIRKNPQANPINAGDGHVWVNPPDLAQDKNMRQLVQDVGCDGKWCTREEGYSLSYGSGNSRLSILIDDKARPVAQLTVESVPPSSEKFIRSLSLEQLKAFIASNPLYKYADRDELFAFAETSPQYAEYLRTAPRNVSITELRGYANTMDLTDSPSLKKIQDRIKDLDRQYGVGYVENLRGVGLTEIPKNRPDLILNYFDLPAKDRLSLKEKFGSETAGFKAILDEAINMNKGSKYFSGNDNQISDLFRDAARTVLRSPANFATGGMVERKHADNRAYL